MEPGDAQFLVDQRHVIEALVAQPLLLARHLLVVLLQREEIGIAAGFGHFDRLRAVLRPHGLGQPHVGGDVPDALVRIAAGMRIGHDRRRLARADCHEEVGEQEPALIVAHLVVAKPADIEALACQRLARRLLQQRPHRNALREGESPVFIAIAGNQFLEARQHFRDGRKRAGQAANALDLFLHRAFRRALHFEGGNRHAVIAEEPVPAVASLEVDHREQFGMDADDVVTLRKASITTFQLQSSSSRTSMPTGVISSSL